MGNTLQGRRELVLAVCGLSGVGKHTLLQSCCGDDSIVTEIPTIGYQINSAKLETADVLLGMVSPCIGNERMWPLFSTYCENCNGLVFMVDATDYHGHATVVSERLDGNTACDDFKRMLGFASAGVGDRTKGLPLLVLVNRMDTVTIAGQEEGESLKRRIAVDLGMLFIDDWTLEGMKAFLMGTHPRLGAQSGVRRLCNVAGILENIYRHMQLAPLQRTALAEGMGDRPCLVQFCAAINGDGIAEGVHWMDESISSIQDRSRKTDAFLPYHQKLREPPLAFLVPTAAPLVQFSFPPQLAPTSLAARKGIAFSTRDAPAYTPI